MLHSLDMKNASPNFIIDIESIHCNCSRSSSQICQLTDLCVEVMKLLSVDPQNYCHAPREGIRSIMEKIDFIRMGTTVATNFLLERKDERMALALTEGWRDPLGNQSRPKMLDLNCTYAYVSVRQELKSFQSDVSNIDINSLFMQSDGGLTPIDKLRNVDIGASNSSN
ncbi:unnamed protein product [Clavelina lepadiformis]|uniref:Hydantoinase/oxoprolinase N-terminal domain-containing protein n=1 Tax=Clavelina lepadiformis TaxID=159417 RepID=A0ABP0G6I6_CLALP